MNKRLRKKLRVGEFQEVGCAIKISATDETIQQVLDELTELADSNGLHFAGGGLGYIILPPNENKNSIVPKKTADLVVSLSQFPDLFPDFVMGYFINATSKIITEKQTSAIQAYLETVTGEKSVNMKCDLWN